MNRMWPTESKRPINLALPKEAGNAVYMAIQNLVPKDDTQRNFKTEASNLAIDVGKVRTLLVAQSIPSISKLMLAVWFRGWSLSFSASACSLRPTRLL